MVGVEHIPQLVEMSIGNMRKDPSNVKLMASGRVRLLGATLNPTKAQALNLTPQTLISWADGAIP